MVTFCRQTLIRRLHQNTFTKQKCVTIWAWCSFKLWKEFIRR